MSVWQRLTGRDRATAYGAVSVVVRYLDGSDNDGDAAGSGLLHVSPDGLLWKIDGFRPGNRDWSDVTSWTETPHAARGTTEIAHLLIGFEGRMRVKRDIALVSITVSVASSPREIATLTLRARHYLDADRISISE